MEGVKEKEGKGRRRETEEKAINSRKDEININN